MRGLDITAAKVLTNIEKCENKNDKSLYRNDVSWKGSLRKNEK